MKKLFLTICLIVMAGSFDTFGTFSIDDYIIYWLWQEDTLIMIDSDNWCLSNNTGEPIDCNDQETTLIKSFFKL